MFYWDFWHHFGGVELWLWESYEGKHQNQRIFMGKYETQKQEFRFLTDCFCDRGLVTCLC